VRAWHDTDADTTQDADEWECLVYDDRWRLVTVYKETSTDPILYELNVPHAAGADGFGGSSYIDSWALRERDKNLDETLETRTYYIQNWRADVISELTDALGPWVYGGSVRYSAYGEHEFLTLGDVSDGSSMVRDGGMTIDDELEYLDYFNNVGGPGADFDDGTGTGTQDGGATIDDLLFYLDVFNAGGLTLDNPRFLYAGYVHDPVIGEASTAIPSSTGSGLYHVRNRVYNPELGRWTRRDPLGYVDGMSLMEYVGSAPVIRTDPNGTELFGWADYLLPVPALIKYGVFRYCGGRSQSEYDLERCEESVAACQKHDPTVKAIMAAIPPACSITIDCAICKSSNLDDALWDPNTSGTGGTIKVCADRMTTGGGSRTCTALAHELIHAEQECRGGAPNRYTGCASRICNEREAIERSGQCCRGSYYRQRPPAASGYTSSWSYSECVKYYTRASSGTTCGSDTGGNTFTSDFNACGTMKPAGPCRM